MDGHKQGKRLLRKASVGAGVVALAVAGMFGTMAPAQAAAAGTEVDVYQSRTADHRDYLPTLYPAEGAPAYIDPQVEFAVWHFPADQVPPGFRAVLRGYNPATGVHFLTTDPGGAGRGAIEGTIGYLAVDRATAVANSRFDCNVTPPPGFSAGSGSSRVSVWDRNGRLGNYQTQPDGSFRYVPAPSIFFAFAERHGDLAGRPPGVEVEELGYGPCNAAPNDAPADQPYLLW